MKACIDAGSETDRRLINADTDALVEMVHQMPRRLQAVIMAIAKALLDKANGLDADFITKVRPALLGLNNADRRLLQEVLESSVHSSCPEGASTFLEFTREIAAFNSAQSAGPAEPRRN